MKAKMNLIVTVGLAFIAIGGSGEAQWSEPVPVAEINTAYEDFAPFLSFDSLTLYFARMDTDTFYYTRIYQATRPVAHGPFTSVQEISTLDYTHGHVSAPWVSPDNLRMYYHGTESGTWRLKVAQRGSVNDLWAPGVNVSELNALGRVCDPHLTVDELTIVFTGENLPGGQGGCDIWMATRPDTNSPFGNVTNLPGMNSSAQDVHPFISADGLTLYFVSTRNGLAQFFKATRESSDAPFGNLEHFSVFDSPDSYCTYPFVSSDGGTFYFAKVISGTPQDVYVSYLIEPGELIGLEIVGPDEVAEDFRANYKAIAYYDSNSVRDVTSSAFWAVDPNDVASIETGLLRTESIGWPGKDITIYAGYSEGEVTVGAQKLVAVFPVCPTGSALRFDGDGDYLGCGNGSSLNLSEVAVSVWVKADSTDRGFSAIVAKGNAYDENYGMYLQETTGIVRFQFSSGGSYTPGETFIDSRTNVLDLSWHHAVGTFNGSVLRLYVDGSLETAGSTTTRKPDANISKTFSVGVRNDATPALYFNGTMDEVAVWNRALSGEEIQANMHVRLSGDEPNLVGYWDFDEGEGQVVYDLSGNGNHGYLGSDPCGVDDSDPAWIESDAPIGICTPYLVAKRAVRRGIAHKIASLEELQAALAEEAVSLDALDDMIRSGNFSDLKKGDIVQAKQMIHSAMQHEQQAKDAVQKGIEKLTASLALLGCQVEPQGSPEAEIEEDVYREVESADIDGDGVVDFADFAKLVQHWLESY